MKKVLAVLGPGQVRRRAAARRQGHAPGREVGRHPAAGRVRAGRASTVHTYTGWGSVTHWNAYVANTQMRGQGDVLRPAAEGREEVPGGRQDRRLEHPQRPRPRDRKLPALHFYQLAIVAPKPPAGSFDAAAAGRGQAVFNGKADCKRCHVPPLFTEPGWPMHTADEIGIDDFQAKRSPDGRYRTTPLAGLFAHTKGGFYHDGRFATLDGRGEALRRPLQAEADRGRDRRTWSST